MTEVSERYARVADGFAARLGGVGPDQWANRTPCEEWTAADLAAHVVNTHRAVLSRLDDSSPEQISSDGDLSGAFSAAAARVSAALDDEAQSAHIVGGMFGERTFESLIGTLLCTDTLVHTWDLARATGQDEVLDEGAVAFSAEAMVPVDEMLRRPGGFGPKIEPRAGADAETRYLNFLGRAV